jgi:glycosyltransferase involved in cell wall biosynthesis
MIIVNNNPPHAARADTFPNTVLEALACGTPVVATWLPQAVGGIPEQGAGWHYRLSHAAGGMLERWRRGSCG